MKTIQLKKILYVVPISTLLLVAGCGPAAVQTFSQDAVVSVDVAKAQKEYIAKGSIYTGVIRPNEEIKIVPEISGKVVQLPIEVGKTVKQGQVLLKLDDRDLTNNVKQAQAAEAAAKAKINSTASGQQSGIASAERSVVTAEKGMVAANSGIIQAEDSMAKAKNAITVAQNDIKNSELAMKNAEKVLSDANTNFNRIKQLYDESLISKAEYEKSELAAANAQTAYDSAKITYQNKVTSLDSAQKAYDTAVKAYNNANESYQSSSTDYTKAQEQVELAKDPSNITASEEAWRQAQVAVQVAQDQLRKALITAPISGVIGQKNTDVGELVSPQSPALTLVDLNIVKVLTYIPAAEINEIKIGSKVQAKTVSFDSVFVGKVSTISPLDEAGKGYPVEIQIPNPDLVLKSGMLIDLQVIPDDAKEGMLIPASAMVEEDGKSYVYVADGDHPKRQEVEAAEKRGSFVVITGGITEKDLIVTNNTSVLSSDVTITYEKPKETKKTAEKSSNTTNREKVTVKKDDGGNTAAKTEAAPSEIK